MKVSIIIPVFKSELIIDELLRKLIETLTKEKNTVRITH